ncbi:MAG: choice-of-anchor B family protein, partial [bacterium]
MKKFFLVVSFLFVFLSAYSQTGFRIRSLANLNQHQFADFISYSSIWGYTAPGGREYAILGCLLGTSFVDITDTNNIREVGFLPIPDGVGGSEWREMKTYSHYCYVVSEAINSKIQIVDLQYLPDSIRYVGLSNFPNHSTTHSISQSGPYLYLNGAGNLTQGVAVVDLANPEVPALRGTWNDIYVHDSRIINDTIWACNIFDGKVSIIDARNKDSLRSIRNWINNPLPNSPHNIAFTNNRNYAFVTNEIGSTPGDLKVWNVSDLDNITLVNTFNPYPFVNSVSHNVEIYNDFAFVAYYSAGVKILNISNPANPVEIGWYDTYPENNDFSYDGCWGVYYFTSGKMIVSDRKRGLFVLKPNLNLPVAGVPKADLTVEKRPIIKYDPQTFIDMTEGFPSSWQWTITGPENHTFTTQNPSMAFNTPGDYTVKLRASNSFGNDSITKINYFRVINVPLITFQSTNPPGPSFRILTSPTDTSKVFFNWKRSTNSIDVYYKIYFRKILGNSEEYILSGNNGRDTSALISKGYLDSMAVRLGLTGDSVRVFYKVMAYNGSDSLVTTNSVTMTIKRTTTGISSINEFVPI